MEYCSLMSGSWGNCHYIKAGGTRIIIDAGQSGKRILNHMAVARCGDGSELEGILVTHAHRDHVIGVGILARKLKIPVYATEGTWFEMEALTGDIPKDLRRIIGTEDCWRIGEFELESFPTSHDALESVGYVLRHGPVSLGIATDCGVFTSRMERSLSNLHGLVLESNHDLNMLRCGNYPEYLKRRIAGVEGHLSNADAGSSLKKVLGPQTRHVVLAHLSEENNCPDIALRTIQEALEDPSAASADDRFSRSGPTGVKAIERQGLRISVAPRCIPGEWMAL